MSRRQQDRWIRGQVGSRLPGPLFISAFVSTVAVTAISLSLAVPAALAVKDDSKDGESHPTEQQIQDARAQVRTKAERVAAIKADLTLADQQLEDSAVRAAIAAEAYNAARWKLREARTALRKAQRSAEQAHADVADQRKSIAALVTRTYVSGTSLQSLDAIVGADGPTGVMDRAIAYEGAADQLQATYDRYRATMTVAELFEPSLRCAEGSTRCGRSGERGSHLGHRGGGSGTTRERPDRSSQTAVDRRAGPSPGNLTRAGSTAPRCFG